MKQILKLSLLILSILLPASASAYSFEINGICYNIGAYYTVSVAFYNGSSGSVSIPSTVYYDNHIYYVTSIGNNAFSNCSRLTSISIPTSITSIGSNAFYRCTGLKEVSIPYSVNSINYSAFEGCTSLKEVIFVGLSSNTTSASSLTIASSSFSNCPIETLYLSRNLSFSGSNSPFRGMTTLKTLKINSSNSISSISQSAFYGCSGLTTLSFLTSSYESNFSVSSIGSDAFNGCSKLASINLPNSIIKIGNNAFYGTAWYNNKPNGMVYAGLVAYKYKGTMPNGTYLTLLANTRSIAANAFYECSGLTSITIPSSVTEIGEYAFYNVPLEYINCKATTPPNIYSNTFNDFGANLSVPYESVTSYQSNTYWKKFTIVFYDFISGGIYYRINENNNVSVTCLNTNYNSYSGEINIPKTVKNNGVTYNVTAIGDNAFRNSTSLESVSIPNTVISIGNYAFSGCI